MHMMFSQKVIEYCGRSESVAGDLGQKVVAVSSPRPVVSHQSLPRLDGVGNETAGINPGGRSRNANVARLQRRSVTLCFFACGF